MAICAIAAMDRGRVIGMSNRLPWNLKDDMRHFKELTMGSSVLMGRNTFESLPEKNKPLPFRRNVVVTSKPEKLKGYAIQTCQDVTEFIANFERTSPDQILWIIGGAKLYASTMNCWDALYLTLVEGDHEGDAFFPPFEQKFTLVESVPGEGCSFLKYVRQ